jgi:TonB family protein
VASCANSRYHAENSCKDASPTVVWRDPPPIRADVTYRKLNIPAYPAQALTDRITGVVLLHVWISKDRSVSRVEVMHVHPSSATVLSVGLADTVRSWAFNPAESFGNPVDGEALVPVRFSIKDDSPPPVAEPWPSLPEGVYMLDAIDVKGSAP